MPENTSYHVPTYNGKPLEEFSRMSDVWFKHIFANPELQLYLIDLLNSLFEDKCPPCMKEGEKITKINFADRELIKQHLNECGVVLDVLAFT